MANKMRSEMGAPVYPAADLTCLRGFASRSAATTHWAPTTIFADANVVAEFGTKRQRLKECFD